ELLHIVIDGSAFFYCCYDGCEVIIGQNHIGCAFSDGGTTSHGDSNLSFFQSWSIVYAITGHGGNITIGLKIFNNFALVSWFHSCEKSSSETCFGLFSYTEVVELSSSVSHSCSVLSFAENADTSADGFSCSFVISSNNNDTDSSLSTILYSLEYFQSWWVEHTNDSNKCDAS
uniref:Uncharacterized protein n=1 Tax=Ciona savignyi TaxID=51511 RepID=H2ZLB3_CIOSA